MAGYFEIICGVGTLLFALYYYLVSNYNFWKVRGVPGPEPIALFGNAKDVVLGKLGFGDYLKELYLKYKDEPMVGFFVRRSPVLVVNDPDLIKDVLIKDFSKFADRGMRVHERAEPLGQHIFSLEPERWRPLRTRISPVFTSGKLKDMFSLILQCAEQLEQYLGKQVEKGEPIECRELTAKYTTDVIGSCAFGIEMNAISDEESEFRRMGRKVFQLDFERIVRIRLRESLPTVYGLLSYILPQTDITKFFTKVISDTMAHRRNNNTVRHDFIDILLDLERNPEKLGNIKLTESLLASQAFVFFAAGFETSATTISSALYELAQHQDIQDKLRKEIREQHNKCNGDMKPENIKEMPYLDKVFRETLRKYPPGSFLLRQSVCDYTFEGTKVSIPKNQKVWISVYGIHHDPSIYPEPEKFDPERFADEACAGRHPMHYMPFGDGPRNCIGARFAVYESKLGMFKILRNYKVDVCEKTVIPFVSDPSSFILAPKGGVYLKITKVE